MRPRKPVILYAENVFWASSMRFALETRLCCKVQVCDTLEDAFAQMEQAEQASVLVLKGGYSEQVLKRAIRLGFSTIEAARSFARSLAHTTVHPDDVSGLMERVQVSLVRKRGPNKRQHDEERQAA